MPDTIQHIITNRRVNLDKTLLDSIRTSNPFKELRRKWESRDAVSINGLPGSFCSALIAALAVDSPVVVAAPDSRRSEELLDDLTVLLGEDEALFLPPSMKHSSLKRLTPEAASHHRAEAMRSLGVDPPRVLVILPGTLAEKFPSRESLREGTLRLKIGAEIEPSALLKRLLNAGFKREVQVDGCGEAALRGGILDLFPYGYKYPLRLEFWGDEINSLRSFDPRNQRSMRELKDAEIYLEREREYSESPLSLMEGVVFWDDMEEFGARYQRITGEELEVAEHLKAGRKSLEHYAIGRAQVDFDGGAADLFLGSSASFRKKAENLLDEGYNIIVGTEAGRREEKFHEFLAEAGEDLFDRLEIGVLPLQKGFLFKPGKLAVFTESELFDRPRPKRSFARFRTYATPIELEDLKSGDFVVHLDYGIGIYRGLKKISVAGSARECLHLQYRDKTNLYVRIESFEKVRKYSGREGFVPAVSKIGGREWHRMRSRAKKAILDMAKELIKTQAHRQVKQGTAFEPDDLWQQQLEDSFIYDETPDQIRANHEIKADMENQRPMDRLLLGDVGFGKTEIALRAAFKAIRSDHQVAILAPTTILVQQHLQTFRDRMADYPVIVESLSRFKTPAEQKRIIQGLRNGTVDVVIGTHRLLSKDVSFKRLGLLVVDEEHRFGVRHKERIKQLRSEVDVLTLTATPIPRTLHQALMGARDMSRIDTPPEDRLPIITEVLPFDKGLIREAILNELKRGGQVFFVHNRVRSIGAIREMLRRIVPEVRYGIAHGQMKSRELEKVMLDFLEKKFEVLICTMIIESGLDLPNVNTMIINRADKLGLAQLYQLRGRIGRSDRQAFAFLLIPPKLSLTGEARSRLETIARFTELGAGFQVALKDLEIRGAGNLLGPQQSGFINSVGFDLYSRMLEEAIHEIRRELGVDSSEVSLAGEETQREIKIEIPGDAHIPADYLFEEDLRVNIYRRLASCGTLDDLSKLEVEITDRFGPIAVPLRNLLQQLRVKIQAKECGMASIVVKKGTMSIEFNGLEESSKEVIKSAVAAAGDKELEFEAGPPLSLKLRISNPDSPEETLTEVNNFLGRFNSSANKN